MSKTKTASGKNTRANLLATVSSVALLGYVFTAGDAIAASGDDDRPIVWVELGGQAERIGDAPELLAPPFFSHAVPTVLSTLKQAQQFPPFSTGLDGKISFQPENSDWVLSAAIRYGKSSNSRHLHHQTAGPPSAYVTIQGQYRRLPFAAYADTHSATGETHTVLDFQAGKDVGLGLFGERGNSVISAGVRFAQFTANSHATLHAMPTYHANLLLHIPGKYTIHTGARYHYTGIIRSSRSTRAIGPSLSWDASLPVVGNSSDMTLNVDWGVNAALLFGRPRARTHHQTQGCYEKGLPSATPCIRSYANPPANHTRSRSVTIPNAGGFAGLSLRFSNARVSLGYRADLFFGALDGGIDARKEESRGFFGPYASLSIGVGD